MHSFDRTLLAKLGFDDPDKKDRRHDLACQYAAAPAVANKITGFLFKERIACGIEMQKLLVAANDGDVQSQNRLINAAKKQSSVLYAPSKVEFFKGTLEKHIQKGQGQYATTIGFADVVLEYNEASLCHKDTPSQRYQDFDFRDRMSSGGSGIILVEVKIQPIDVGSIIRQLNLYRAYFQHYSTLTTLALCYFPLAGPDIDTLGGAGIHYLKLGQRFDEYVSWRETEQKSTEKRYDEV